MEHWGELRDATANDADALAAFIVRRCAEPSSHCLQSWSGESFSNLQVELRRSLLDGSLFVIAEQNEQVVAALGADVEGDRLWVKGPHLLVQDESGPALATALWRRLLARCDGSPRQLTAFVAEENAFARQFWESQGLSRQAACAVFSWDAQTADEPYVALKVLPARGDDEAGVRRLLAEAFPGAQPALPLLERTLVVQDARGEVCGFVILHTESAGEASIDYLAVTPSSRRRGIGRQLLLSAMAGLQRQGARRVRLSVGEGSLAARSLYEAVGFQLVYRGVPLSWAAPSTDLDHKSCPTLA